MAQAKKFRQSTIDAALKEGYKNVGAYQKAKAKASRAGFSSVKDFKNAQRAAKRAGYKSVGAHQKAKAASKAAGFSNLKKYKEHQKEVKKQKARQRYAQQKANKELLKKIRAKRAWYRLRDQLEDYGENYGESFYEDFLEEVAKHCPNKGDCENITADEVITWLDNFADRKGKREKQFDKMPNASERTRKF